MGCVATSSAAIKSKDVELPPDNVIFGGSTAGEAVRLSTEMAATTNLPVLLQGQSGTGKEVLAKYIHNRSTWGCGAFVKVNCPAIPGPLIESELFGYQKGAFTGAYVCKPGRVELAHGGTLFLDEIAELELGLQAKLLQLLQDGRFCRIGDQEERGVEVRFVCATNRQLEREIRTGTFRQDLFYRVNVLTIELPPLRERICDLPILVDYLQREYAKKFDRPVKPLSARTFAFLRNYSWPGNIRELENVMKRYVIAGQEEVIFKALQSGAGDYLDIDGSEDDSIEIDGNIKIKQVVRQAAARLERRIILKMLDARRWNRRITARALGISYAALLYKLRQAGIPARRYGSRKNVATLPLVSGGRPENCNDLAQDEAFELRE
jgi:two-component system response regulator AtoC